MSTTMAAMSAAPATTTLTPPSSSHGNGYLWNAPSGGQSENPVQGKKTPEPNDYTNGFPARSRPPLAHQNGNSAAFASNLGADSAASRKGSGGESYTNMKGTGLLSPPPGAYSGRPGSIKDGKSPSDSPVDIDPSDENGDPSKEPGKEPGKESNKRPLYGADPDDVSSMWIHRDKLARIESQELQAAGIILPKPRARSKPPRELSLDGSNGRGASEGEGRVSRSRKNSTAISEPKTPEIRIPSWDLRMPDEIATESDPYFVLNNGANGASRIPVAKLSPVPVPLEHIERDTPMPRKREDSPGAEDKLLYTRTRSRSGSMKAFDSGPLGTTPQPKRAATDTSPRKNATAARKGSAPGKVGGSGRGQKTRKGDSKDSTSSSGGQTRPTTRSGERELSPGAAGKQPEGDPPWMVSAYKPDPRLPPDQQLLPTVARRLQQEKWEKEGKFGNIYDREFRPLTDEGFLEPPEPEKAVVRESSRHPDKAEEWPLKPDTRSGTPGLNHQGRTGSYSTIPKIQDKPNVSPLPSPRGPMLQKQESATVRVPDLPEEVEQEQQKKGCGCCIVM